MANGQPKSASVLNRQLAPDWHLSPGPQHRLRLAKDVQLGETLDHTGGLHFEIESIRTEPRFGLIQLTGKSGTLCTWFAPDDKVRLIQGSH